MSISNIWIVDEVSVEATYPEIGDGQAVANEESALGAKWLNNTKEFWETLVEDLGELFSMFLRLGEEWLVDDREQALVTFEEVVDLVCESWILWIISVK